MKKIILAISTAALTFTSGYSQNYWQAPKPQKQSTSIYGYGNTNQNTGVQSGYYKPSTGSYVAPSYHTQRVNTNTNNFSTQGNQNPYTQQLGTKPRDYSAESQSLHRGKTVYTGPNGGQYYINSNGNKTYLPKN